MIVSVVAVGDSAKDWYKTPCDLSIGVNDVLKHGHDVDQLLIINFPRKFTSDRMHNILKSKAKVFTHTSAWKTHFPKAEVIRLSPFAGYVHRGQIYCSKTSPIAAMSLAIKQKATEIILWGCDFKSHHAINESNKKGLHEIKVYQKFFAGVEKLKIKIYRGADGGVFDSILPKYPWKENFELEIKPPELLISE
jgi:hypothetical protein